MRKIITEEQANIMREENLAGLSLVELAKKYNLARNTIYRAIINAGGARPRPAFTKEECLQLNERYLAGETIIEIADSCNVDRGTVSRSIHSIGGKIKRGPKNVKEKIICRDGYKVLVYSDDVIGMGMAKKVNPSWPNGGAYVLEHRLVMARSLGRSLETMEKVIHKNGDKLDNRLENLEMKTGHKKA